MSNQKKLEIEGQHNSIRVAGWDAAQGLSNPHPEAQWFAHAGLGMFLHWGISAVSGEFDLSWGMITGWELAHRKITQAEADDMVRRKCYRDSGKETTPNEYFALAERFLAEKYNPDEWLYAAKKAGFTYAVLTTRHHDGFALWPSKFGGWNTNNYLHGRNLVGEFVQACRKYGIRVGLYYSPPDWYFNRDYMSYLIYTAKKNNPMLPDLDANYDPVKLPNQAALHAHNRLYADYVNGQLEELLTEFGKIDLLWLDGSMPDGFVFPLEKIRALQPGIVVNHRMHGTGDFETCEVTETAVRPKKWWEFCTQWPSRGWAYLKNVPYRSLGEITSEFVRTLAWGGNYLLDIGPMADGTFPPEAKAALSEFTQWHTQNREGLTQVLPLAENERCSVPAVAKDNCRYLYLLPGQTASCVEFSGNQRVVSARFLDNGVEVDCKTEENVCVCTLPQNSCGFVRILRLVLA